MEATRNTTAPKVDINAQVAKITIRIIVNVKRSPFKNADIRLFISYISDGSTNSASSSISFRASTVALASPNAV